MNRHAMLQEFLIVITSLLSEASIQTIFQWRYFDFVWPSRSAREQAIQDGSYNHSLVFPSDIDIAQDGRVFISFGSVQGTPARFGVVTQYQDFSGLLIQPYPDWKWFNIDNCDDTMLTIIRFKIDQCNRLWIVDSGWDGLKILKCPPKLLVFDLLTNTLLWKETIPHTIAFGFQEKESRIVTIIIDTHESRCSHVTEIVAQDEKRFNFIGGMKFIQNLASSEEELWVIATKNLDQYYEKLNFNEFNYYVTKISVVELTRGTRCEMLRERFSDSRNFYEREAYRGNHWVHRGHQF
ncbi:hypothetical protein QAD02_006192 [Eretmocerus hayati]|uniref:Uncharacterized protein n=1 Tax=Eretmocerus hayati TaxID=131215 RepID=A0ACC2N4C6_9HYME|nr:hypothetical protein QAD02_006192 [Eretmocerus hayati]